MKNDEAIDINLLMKYDPSIILRRTCCSAFVYDTMVLYNVLRHLNKQDGQGGMSLNGCKV